MKIGFQMSIQNRGLLARNDNSPICRNNCNIQLLMCNLPNLYPDVKIESATMPKSTKSEPKESYPGLLGIHLRVFKISKTKNWILIAALLAQTFPHRSPHCLFTNAA